VFERGLFRTLVAFIESIGIPAVAASSIHPTAFPGLDIQHGCVLIDETRVVYPGDILHEAGHLAVTDPQRRLAQRLNPTGGEELSALAWSYAAVVHLQIDPALVFYPASYHNFGNTLLENFTAGRYIGLPMLQMYGMTVIPGCGGDKTEDVVYPKMRRWLR
jgi:hypothetical protein